MTAKKFTFMEAQINAEGLRLVAVVSRFNSFITERLLEGSLDAFLRHGGLKEDFTTVKVPGAFELPMIVKKLIETSRFDVAVALGAVIRGSTPHFDYVAAEVSKGLAHVQLDLEFSIGFGVLTCDTVEQAVERAGTKSGNKGYDATLAAIETARLIKQIKAAGRV
ncbi:MAG: 6,7-dimethyl-8-ribityllumazine synthase [Deltaproteobacteria bacterium]|nr:6,7-dimethyl-8-ribityllumazine synthase [Deltaproteobacteria bacterium]